MSYGYKDRRMHQLSYGALKDSETGMHVYVACFAKI